MDAPEGNLVIVERCIHERQHHFSCREYGWVGSAHRFGAGTEYEWKGRIEKWVNSSFSGFVLKKVYGIITDKYNN